MPETKICITCNQEKSLDNYYVRSDSGKHNNRCKKCCVENKKVERSSTHKKCKHCGEIKSFSEYQKAGGGKWLQPYCKPCDARRKKEYCQHNSNRIKAKSRENYLKRRKLVPPEIKEENKKKAIEKLIKFNRERVKNMKRVPIEEKLRKKKEWEKKYKQENKEKIRLWKIKNIEKVRKQRRDNQAAKMSDPVYRLKKNLRSRIRVALMGIIKKSDTTQNILGCTFEEFKNYIEASFKEGMNWDNYGKNGWHIDHKIPVSWFNLENPNCLKAAFNYKNHQPLWWDDNLKKGNKFYHKIY